MIRDYSYGIVPLKKLDGQWQVLLIQHSKALYWGFPKGHAEGNELPKEAATRELFEETQLKVKSFLFDDPLDEHYQFTWNKELISKTVYYFIAEVTGHLKLQLAEVSAGKWVPLLDAVEALTYEGDKSVCRQTIQRLE